MVRPLVNVPRRIVAGEAFEVRILIQHPMESGQRRDAMGAAIPRDIIHSFEATFEGELVFAATLYPAIAANPFLSFSAVVSRSGTLVMRWLDDHGAEDSESVAIALA